MSEWISVDEKTPEVDAWYLIVDTDNTVNMSEFKNGRWWMWPVSYWQPLPDPPK